MEAKNVIDQEEKLNATNLEGIHYEYKYNPEFKRYDIEFEIDDNCDQRILDFIENLYQKSKGSNFQFDAIQNEEQRRIIELLLMNKPPVNSNRPILSGIGIHQATFSVKITSKKNTLTEAQKIQLIRHWNVPNLPTHFIGRETLLTEIAQRLNLQQAQMTNVVITACHGLGGIGKTFLAARYAQLHMQDYTFILWFNAENETTLTNDYHNFADAIRLPVEGQSPENIITIVKNWLQQQANWLIIYDNAPDDKLIIKFRPAKGGKILITSRKDAWLKKDSLTVDVFSLKEARNYIVELTGFSLDEHQERIDELAKILGYLPLALAQACAYITARKISLEKYLALYAENRAAMLAKSLMPPESNYKFSVAITWNITFKAIEEEQPTAISLLESCAFLQGNTIPEFLLEHIFNKQQPTFTGQLEPFIDVLGCLQQYSMLKNINNTQKDKTFSMHNLVQEVIFDILLNEKKKAYLLDVSQLLREIFPWKKVEQVEDYAKQRSLLPHLEKGLQRIEEWIRELKRYQDIEGLTQIEKVLYVPLLELSAHGYSNLGDTCKAKELLEQALMIEEQHYGKDHLEVASTLVNLANAYGELGDLHKKKALLEQALVIFESHYEKDHLMVATTLHNLANAYGALEDVCKKKKLLEQALVIKEQHYGKNYPEVAGILADLANAYGELGDAHKKKELLEQALVIFEQHYEKGHLVLALTLGNLATAYGALGDVHKKKELLEQALVIQEQHYGKEHLVVARTLGNLGDSYGALGDMRKKKELLGQTLAIFEQHYGKEHLEVARVLNSLTTTYRELGNTRKAKELLERVLEIVETHYGKDHPDVAVTLNNLAIAYGKLGDARKKKELLERVLVIEEQYYGQDHLEVAHTLNNLATAYGELGDVRKKKELLEQALVIKEQHYGKNHPAAAILLYDLAPAYASLGKWPIAKRIAECAYHIFFTHPNAGPQHPDTQAAKKRLDQFNEMLATFSPEQLSALCAHGKTLVTERNSLDFAKALRNAANQNDVEKLKELLSQGIDVNAKDDGQHGRTALHWAVIKQAYPCIKLLLTTGADVMMIDRAGKSSVDYAGENPIPDALFLLLNHHYKLPLEDIEPGKLLRRAAHQNKVNDIKLLLKHIKDVNEKDTGNSQRTALHWAVIQEATDCIEALIATGADPIIVDASGKTALDYAKGKGQILELLERNQTMSKVQQK